MKKLKILSVRLNGKPVGQLEQTKDGKLKFQYQDDASQISLSMPLENKRFGNMPCEKYFGGLLPESEEAKRQLEKNLAQIRKALLVCCELLVMTALVQFRFTIQRIQLCWTLFLR